jgi:hypothetical protein
MTQALTDDVLSFDYPANPPVGASSFFESQGAGTWNVQSTIARNGRKALRLQPSTNQAWVRKFMRTGTGNVDLAAARFYIEFEDFPDADCYLLSWPGDLGGSTKHFGLAFNSGTNRIRPRVASTFGADGSALSLGVWYRIDAWMDYDLGTDAFLLKWQIEGVDQTDFSTTTADSPLFSSIIFGNWDANCTGDFSIDDYVAIQILGSYPSYPIGAGECFYRTSNADGTHNNGSDFTDDASNSPPASVYDRLDEGPSSSVADYVFQDTANAASYLEVEMEDIVSQATRQHGGVLRWAHTRPAVNGDSGQARTYSPDESAEWAVADEGSVLTNKQYRAGAERYLEDETAFSMAKLNATVVRIGYGASVTTYLRSQDVHEEWALAEGAPSKYGWGILL